MTTPNRFANITTNKDLLKKAAEIMECSATPTWVANLICEAVVRDPVDVANHMEMLAELFARRCELVMQQAKPAEQWSPEEIAEATAKNPEPLQIGNLKPINLEDLLVTASAQHVRGYLANYNRPGKEAEFLMDILTTAVESGGIGYWATIKDVVRDPEDYILAFNTRDREDASAEWKPVSPEGIKSAILDIIIPSSTIKINPQIRDTIRQAYMENDAGNIDAEAADVIVQVAVYGEIVFG